MLLLRHGPPSLKNIWHLKSFLALLVFFGIFEVFSWFFEVFCVVSFFIFNFYFNFPKSLTNRVHNKTQKTGFGANRSLD